MVQQQFSELWTQLGIKVYEGFHNSSSKMTQHTFFLLNIFSQFDLISFRQQNLTFTRREGDFSTLQVSFNLQRHTGYFLIQVGNVPMRL